MTGVSPRWETIPPSGRLADILAGTDLSAHSDDGILSVIAATEKALSWLRAVQLRALAEFDRRRPTDEFAGEEVAAVLTLSPRTGINRLDWAIEVSRRLPRALAATETGSVSYAQLRVMAEETLLLPLYDIPAVEEHVLANIDGKTPGQVRRLTKRAAMAVNPQAAVQREDTARAERRVVVNPLPDGMAELIATLPAAHAHTLYHRLDDIARHTHDSRSMDQRRADALTHLAAAGTASRPLIQVVLNETTLTGRDNHPAELVGYGPITAETARDIAADGIWQALHADTKGVITDVGRHRYRPSDTLTQLIRTRDRRCRHYGCEQPAHRADIDHTTRYPDGPTTPDNLATLCRRHHRMKHANNGWKLKQQPNAKLEWTSPTGRKYATNPSTM